MSIVIDIAGGIFLFLLALLLSTYIYDWWRCDQSDYRTRVSYGPGGRGGAPNEPGRYPSYEEKDT